MVTFETQVKPSTEQTGIKSSIASGSDGRQLELPTCRAEWLTPDTGGCAQNAPRLKRGGDRLDRWLRLSTHLDRWSADLLHQLTRLQFRANRKSDTNAEVPGQ